MPPAHAAARAPVGPQLLVAVTGSPGDGKTRLLAAMAAEFAARGERVEGVLSVAGQRPDAAAGALHYFLRIVGRPGELLWATRNEALDPPYAFDAAAAQVLREWAEAQAARPGAPLMVLDEFGRFEVNGHGLTPLWPALAAARPAVAIISVRRGLREDVERLLGRKFDVCIEATAPDALARLRRACEDFGEWTRLGLFGAAAGGIELTVGSLLHALRIPLRGLMLASLQGALMTFSGFGLSQPARVVWVPFISAGLKALSPAGSRVRPMIAICAQGLLFGAAVQTAGWNLAGVALGGALIGAWSALQGVFLQYLLIGDELVRAYDAVVVWMMDHWHLAPPSIWWVAAGWATVCGLVAAGIAGMAWQLRAPPAALQRIIERETSTLRTLDSPVKSRSRWREFLHWQFWLPLVLVSTVLLATGRPVETVAWLAVRFVAVGFVLLTLVSFLRPAALADALRRRGWWGPAIAFSGALERRTERR